MSPTSHAARPDSDRGCTRRRLLLTGAAGIAGATLNHWILPERVWNRRPARRRPFGRAR